MSRLKLIFLSMALIVTSQTASATEPPGKKPQPTYKSSVLSRSDAEKLQLGLKAAVVEKRGTLGGTCLNVGCIPSKALLHASHLYAEAGSHFKKVGIETTGLSVNWPQMQTSKEKAVTGLTKGIEGLMKKNKVDYIIGTGTITGANEVSATLNAGGNEVLKTKNILIATGV